MVYFIFKKFMKINKIIFSLLLFFSLSFCFLPLAADAQGLWNNQEGLGKNTDSGDVGRAYGSPTGDDRDVRHYVINIIKVFLGILGILFVVLVIWGGFRWMTSAGNQDQVAEAKKILWAGIIGFVIIMSTLVIVNVVTDTVENKLFKEDIFG